MIVTESLKTFVLSHSWSIYLSLRDINTTVSTWPDSSPWCLDCNLLFFFFRSRKQVLDSLPPSALLIILFDFVVPAFQYCGAFAECSNRFAHHTEIQFNTFTVLVVVLGTVCGNAEPSRHFYGVNVCAEKNELPPVLCLLPLNLCFNLLRRILPAGISLTICDDGGRRTLKLDMKLKLRVWITELRNYRRIWIQKKSLTFTKLLI